MNKERAEELMSLRPLMGSIPHAFAMSYNTSDFKPHPEGMTKDEYSEVIAVWNIIAARPRGGSTCFMSGFDRFLRPERYTEDYREKELPLV